MKYVAFVPGNGDFFMKRSVWARENALFHENVAYGPGLGDQRAEQGAQLDLGLLQLGGGVGAGDDAVAGEKPRPVLPEQPAAQGQRQLAVAAAVDPAHRARVPAAVEAL